MQNLNLCKTHRFIELLVKITYAYLYTYEKRLNLQNLPKL